jgi:hypothetical protein
MKVQTLILIFFFISTELLGAARNLDEIFQNHKVKLHKSHQQEGIDTFVVDFPYDPLSGGRLWKLRKDILVSNNCRPFIIISPKDQTMFKFNANRRQNSCTVTEEVTPYSAE